MIHITDKIEAQEKLERRARESGEINELTVGLASVSATDEGFRLIADRPKAGIDTLVADVSPYDAE